MFDNQLWEEWSEAENTNYSFTKSKKGHLSRKYLKKGYLHFDNRFWFPERLHEVKYIIQNNLKCKDVSGKTNWHAFSPFLKILLKTPRYKDQTGEGDYELESKIRPICFASHLDSLIFGYYSYALSKKYEGYIKANGFSDCILAYRTDLQKCNIQFSKEIFDYVRSHGNCTALALDIKGYFDNIDHKVLKETWSKIIGGNLPEDQYKIFKALTRYSYVSKKSILKKYKINLTRLGRKDKIPQNLLSLLPGGKDIEKFKRLREDKLIVTNLKKGDRQYGIPQGSALSALLSNIYLIDYDKVLFKKSIEENFLYRRYCDDIIIVCDTKKAMELQKFAIDTIKEHYFLTIQDKKVEITEFKPNSKGIMRAFNKKKMIEHEISETAVLNEGKYYKSLQYLGFEFNGQNVFIRGSSLSRYFRKMKSRIEKTVSMSYGKNAKSDKIFKEQLFHRYSHLGKRNFIKYAYNSSKGEYLNHQGKIKEGHNSPTIKKQLKRHFTILLNSLNTKNVRRYIGKKKTEKDLEIKTT
jgi:RNA-directed DNA polymerase